jgi:hypothetical protein
MVIGQEVIAPVGSIRYWEVGWLIPATPSTGLTAGNSQFSGALLGELQVVEQRQASGEQLG